MKKQILNLKWAMVFIIPAIIISGCNPKATVSKIDAYKLEYKLSGDQPYKYLQDSKITQSIVYMGQEINTVINSCLGFTALATGASESDVDINITIDSLGYTINSVQGNMVEDMDELAGEKFNMSMSKNGKVRDLDEAEKLKYTVAGTQSADMKSSFTMIFPTLPAENIKIAHTWTDTDTIDVSTPTDDVQMIMTSNNTVESREELNGYDCFRIGYTMTGTRDGSSTTPQGIIVTSSDLSGSGHYYFAFKEGIIIKDHAEIMSEGEVVIPGGEAIPMNMETIIKMDLMK